MLQTFTLHDLHDIIDALSTALDAKHPFTLGHSTRVSDLSLAVAKSFHLPVAEQERIHIGAHLHDIGKIGIPDAILNKPGRLAPAEFAVIKEHPVIGASIVGKVQILLPIVDIVRHHHERFDGTGYPDQLGGSRLSLGVRIVTAVDAFDAMTSSRHYRPALTVAAAITELRRCRGSQFDPGVVDALVKIIEQK